MWRIALKRWYVFRDAPTWFVNEAAEIADIQQDDPDYPVSEIAQEWMNQVKAERDLRKRKDE